MVSRGNQNATPPGDIYTVTVKNNGTVSTTEMSLSVDPNVGFFYVAGSAAVKDSGLSAVSVTQSGTDPFVLSLTGTPAQKALEPGETVTFTFRLATSTAAKSGQLLAVNVQSGSPTPGSCGKGDSENVATGWGNLVVQKNPKVQNGEMGDVITWTVELRNTGLGDVYNALLTDTIGAGYTDFNIDPGPRRPDL